jgi:hypothetical protein
MKSTIFLGVTPHIQQKIADVSEGRIASVFMAEEKE